MGIMVEPIRSASSAPTESIFLLDGAPATLGGDNVYDFDLAKQKREAAKESGLTEEQVKANELAKKENEKIKGINALLALAVEQKKNKRYDEAVATMEQAAAADQKHDVVYASLADAYLLEKKYPEAESAYNKAIALAPPTSKALASYHSSLALALLRQDKTQAGMAECDKTTQLIPPRPGSATSTRVQCLPTRASQTRPTRHSTRPSPPILPAPRLTTRRASTSSARQPSARTAR